MKHQPRVDLRELLKQRRFDHALFATYSLDARFFEQYCLRHLRALKEAGNVIVLTDVGVHDELLGAPAGEGPLTAGARYALVPLSCGRLFHPKVYLLATEKRGLLVVGSANLTKAGVTSNAELVGVYHFEDGKDRSGLPMFHDAVRFFQSLAARSPRRALKTALSKLLAGVPWLVPEESPGGVYLRHNIETPLWEQFINGVNRPAKSLHVLSRFFDGTPALLQRVIDDIKPQEVVVWTQNGAATLSEAWFRHPALTAGVCRINGCVYEDEGHSQTLHAKALAVVHERGSRILFGSPNFTAAALAETASVGNLETAVFIDVPKKSFEPHRLFDPLGSAVPLASFAEVQPVAVEPPPQPYLSALKLIEAYVADSQLCCTLHDPVGGATGDTWAVLTLGDGGRASVPLVPTTTEGAWVGSLPTGFRRSEHPGTIRVFVERARRSQQAVRSNPVTLLDLVPVSTGGGGSHRRKLREAEGSLGRFLLLHQELLKLDDEQALLRFLTHCNIKLLGGRRGVLPPGARDAFDSTAGLRELGTRNLRHYATLHDAVVGFCERHERKVRKHSPAIGTCNSVLHIVVACAHVLLAQLDRIAVGLEHVGDPLSVEDWYKYRCDMDQYFSLFRESLAFLHEEYLPTLAERYPPARIHEAAGTEIAESRRVCGKVVSVGERIEAARQSRLKVRIQYLRVVPAPMFKENTLYPTHWQQYKRVIMQWVASERQAGRA